ncbi:hypothetical protein OKC48_11250 [Methylorubrum extorquens]|uniref:hypothetical protein n=1 Tax=Methylorubrum extorquens TaxID=408 RepID=UPI00223750F2|nr:hypothetical protein [Methylorubrum extorquens]UYW29046.1 hypothetical protein OKC48_11250 [Methylorubrum extorquens]
MAPRAKVPDLFVQLQKEAAENQQAGEWEKRLLNRPLFDMPSLAEQPVWRRWRGEHEAEIDHWVSRTLRSNARTGPQIDADLLAVTWGCGWCPHYMARWHTVFAASMANMRLGWAPFECERVREMMVEQDRQGGTARSSRQIEAETLVETRRRVSRAALADVAQEAMALRERLPPCDSIGSDVPDLSALTPQKAGAYSRALGNVREHLRAIVSELEVLEALAGNPDAVQRTDDVATWCQEFAGYMAVGWERMTGTVWGEGKQCVGFISDAFDSLWPDPPEPRDWRVKARWARKHSPSLGLHPRLNAHPFGRKDVHPQSR